MSRLLFSLLIPLFLFSERTSAQEGIKKSFSFTVAPLHLFTGSIKGEFEYRTPKQIHGISLTPQFHFAHLNGDLKNYPKNNKFTGIGAEIQHKLYFTKIEKDSDYFDWRVYIAYAIAYHQFDHRYRESIWIPKVEDGSTYLYYRNERLNDVITRMRYSILMGVQKRTALALFECYMGVSYQQASVNQEYPLEELVNYEEGYFNYGYTGFLPRLGLKIGFFIF